MKKVRLDVLLTQRELVDTRSQAQGLIMTGQVLVDETPVFKAGTKVPPDVVIRIKGQKPPFVSRGGLKLQKALDTFEVDPTGRVCVDLGASTGGFTDCLLQRGAARVYAVDVGYGQLAWSLRQDERVIVMERTNARTLESLPEPIELVVGDLSFISLGKVLPAVARIAPGADCLVLVKPQFEVGPDLVEKGGVVNSQDARDQACLNVQATAEELGFLSLGLTESPIRGAKSGNIEYLAWLRAPRAQAR